jgi:50S ribosomal protein L16 3-hydroxylase
MRYHTNMKKTRLQNNGAISNTPLALLGGITAEEFLTEYWQKKPLLIRNAISDFQGLLSPDELAGLACEEDVQSRLISFDAKHWVVEQGPFNEARFSQLPEQGWTLLVQELNHHLQDGAQLLKQFNFIPYARLDDLMVSYAPDGGGVGPHFDSYDVFLLQGMGQRLWRISEQNDLSLQEGAPLRILKNFNTEQEWILSPGDMLYLPPHVAHWGIAVGECMTYSIGFRAPSAQEFGVGFLNYLQEHKSLTGQYHDPDLDFQSEPAEISDSMITKVSRMLEGLKWNDKVVGDFIGHYLTEPKVHVYFDVPTQLVSLDVFKNTMMKIGIKLSLKSQMLFNEQNIYLNGDKIDFEVQCLESLKLLANHRMLDSNHCHVIVNDHPTLITLFFDWYQTGYLTFLEE